MARLTIWDTGIGDCQGRHGPAVPALCAVRQQPGPAARGHRPGLSLVNRLTILHHGSVTGVESRLGRGSHFTVTLPWHPPGRTLPRKLTEIRPQKQNSRRWMAAKLHRAAGRDNEMSATTFEDYLLFMATR